MSNIIVIKIGSSTLVGPSGKLNHHTIYRIAAQVSEILSCHKHVIIVSSGAIVAGREVLGYKDKPRAIQEKQAAAAIGQSILMHHYQKAFDKYSIKIGQILLTPDIITDRVKKHNAFITISTLLKHQVVPIVNENDTVATDEIKVGDNDNLSAMVAVLMNAELLINLSDVDGFYMKTENGSTFKIDEIERIDSKIEQAATLSGTKHGTGGMTTKIQAAKICNAHNIPMVIAHGKESDIVNIVLGAKIGTRFTP